jgi:hypothetical protein
MLAAWRIASSPGSAPRASSWTCRTSSRVSEVSGRYVERTRQVILEGSTVTDAPHDGPGRLALGSYSFVLTADERSLVQGRWGSTAQNEAGFAGEWEAVR